MQPCVSAQCSVVAVRLSRLCFPQHEDFNYTPPWAPPWLLLTRFTAPPHTRHSSIKINIPCNPMERKRKKKAISNDLISSTHVDICRYDRINMANTKHICFSLSLSSAGFQLEVLALRCICPPILQRAGREKQLKIIEIVSLNNFDICSKGVCLSYPPLQYFSDR